MKTLTLSISLGLLLAACGGAESDAESISALRGRVPTPQPIGPPLVEEPSEDPTLIGPPDIEPTGCTVDGVDYENGEEFELSGMDCTCLGNNEIGCLAPGPLPGPGPRGR